VPDGELRQLLEAEDSRLGALPGEVQTAFAVHVESKLNESNESVHVIVPVHLPTAGNTERKRKRKKG
jgi:hypothetical protein